MYLLLIFSSRVHIPTVFHDLMTKQDSPIIDFYPATFQIDMNGKRMAWQGVALLPFIDEKRLLDAMAPRYPNLTEEEIKRNKWGNNVLFVFEENPLYSSLEALYGKRKNQDVSSYTTSLDIVLMNRQPVQINPQASRGINGSLLPNPDCLPGSTYICPLTKGDLPDIKSDRSLSALFFFPKQLTPHRSVLLPGVQRPRPALTESDRERASRSHHERGFHSQMGQQRPPPGMWNGQNGRNYNDRPRDNGPRSGPTHGGYNNGYGGYGGNNHRDNNYNSSYSQASSYGSYGQGQQSYGSYGSHQGQQSYQQPGYQQPGYRGRGGSSQGGSHSYDRGRGRGGRGGYDGGSRGNHQPYGGRSYDNYAAPSYDQGGYNGSVQGGFGRGGSGGARGRGGHDNSYGGGQSYNQGGYGGYGQGSYGSGRGGYNNSGRGRGRQW